MATQRFTDRWLQSSSLIPAAGRAEYVDALCPGLHLRVTIKGTRTFSAMFRVNGELRRQTIGRYPAVTLSAARDVTLDMMRKAQNHENARERRTRAANTFTVAELVEQYTEKHLKPNARSWKAIHSGLTSSTMHPLLKRQATSVTRRELIAAIDDMVTAGLPQAAVNHLRRLKMLFNWAAGRDLIDVNPTNGIKPPAKTTERDRVLSDAEVAAVWKATLQLPTPYQQMYRVFFLTGQRRSEVSNMRWNEVADDVWTIPRERVKKDRAHAVPLSKTALSTLASLPCYGSSAFVFTTTGGESASSNFNKTKAELDHLSGVTGWTIHDIRRTVRTKLAELGVPREVARKVTNHEDGRIDRTYNRHEYLKEKREALTRWETRLLKLTARPTSRVHETSAWKPVDSLLAILGAR